MGPKGRGLPKSSEAGGAAARDTYLNVLKAGGSDYPTAILKRAGLDGLVDLRTAGAAQALTEYDDDAWDLIFLDAERPEYPGYWANLDTKRPRKKAGFVVDLGTKVSPIVTPEKPEAFESVLRDRANLGTGNARQMKGPFI